MSYIEQRKQWLSSHPEATAEEAFTAGYLTATDNWCNKRR